MRNRYCCLEHKQQKKNDIKEKLSTMEIPVSTVYEFIPMKSQARKLIFSLDDFLEKNRFLREED
jgi:hypothetical protein